MPRTALAVFVLFAGLAQAAMPAGYQASRRVQKAGLLDWEFVSGGGRLPVGYDSRRQRYQFFSPATYKPAKAWPLVIWLSPGDAPAGWGAMERACVEKDLFFVSPYGIGVGRPLSQRVRTVLDVLEDVSRDYRIDPARTYIVGQGGASGLACRVAYSMPELFGGVAVIDGEAPLPALSHLRHRLQGRLSVAFLATAPGWRAVFEKSTAGLYRDLRVRSKAWAGKADADTLKAMAEWLEGGQDARLVDLRLWRVTGKPGATPEERAAAALEKARLWMDRPAEQYRAAAVLEWLVARHGRGKVGAEARKLYDEWRKEPRKGQRLAEVIAADRRPVVRALARAEERRGRIEEAYALWAEALRLTADREEREAARKQADRLGEALAKIPYLGMTFEGDTTIVRSVEPGGPAYRAGLRAGDRLHRLGEAEVKRLADVRAALAPLRPGDSPEVHWLRMDTAMKRQLAVGSRLAAAKAKAGAGKGE